MVWWLFWDFGCDLVVPDESGASQGRDVVGAVASWDGGASWGADVVVRVCRRCR